MNKSLLFGVLGVGKGHLYREMPIIEHYLNTANIAIFSSGDAYSILKRKFEASDNVRVIDTRWPYFIDGENGIDFAGSISYPRNKETNFFEMASRAMQEAQDFIGTPDLVIADYEATAAQLAYAKGAKLITLDQQSRFLVGDFPIELRGTNFIAERDRLRMFFPKADKRLICSFYNFEKNTDEAIVIPPILRGKIVNLERTQGKKSGEILVYFSELSVEEIQKYVLLFKESMNVAPSYSYSIYARGISALSPLSESGRISLHEPNEDSFIRELESAEGVICTAGHNLISEAMYLGLPILAIPRRQYEAILCGNIIEEHNFGLSAPDGLSDTIIQEFLKNLAKYSENILADKSFLNRRDGKEVAISEIEKLLK